MATAAGQNAKACTAESRSQSGLADAPRAETSCHDHAATELAGIPKAPSDDLQVADDEDAWGSWCSSGKAAMDMQKTRNWSEQSGGGWEQHLRLITPRQTMLRATGIETNHGKRTILGIRMAGRLARKTKVGMPKATKAAGILGDGILRAGILVTGIPGKAAVRPTNWNNSRSGEDGGGWS